MLALGLSLYLYVPLASHDKSAGQLGLSAHGGRLCSYLEPRTVRVSSPTDSLSRYADQLGMYGEGVLTDFGVIYVLPVLVPFWFVRRMRARERRWMLGLLAVFLCLSLLMVALLNPSPERYNFQLVERFFSASHLVLAIWAGYGLALLGAILTRAEHA